MISVRFASVSYSLARGKTWCNGECPVPWHAWKETPSTRKRRQNTHAMYGRFQSSGSASKITNVQSSVMEYGFFFDMYLSSLRRGFKNPYVFGSTPGGQHVKKKWSGPLPGRPVDTKHMIAAKLRSR